MKVSVLFFGYTSDLAGCRSCEVELPEGTRSSEALDAIKGRFPKLEGIKPLFSVNQEYADGGETIKEGDELAVFTAISGG